MTTETPHSDPASTKDDVVLTTATTKAANAEEGEGGKAVVGQADPIEIMIPPVAGEGMTQDGEGDGVERVRFLCGVIEGKLWNFYAHCGSLHVVSLPSATT